MKSLNEMETLMQYTQDYGVKEVVNSMGERRYTRLGSIVFPNGRVASIVESEDDKENTKKVYSVATCDYNGYFDWGVLNQFGATKGKFICNTELDIIIACEKIRNLPVQQINIIG